MTQFKNFGAFPSRSARWYCLFGVFLAAILLLGASTALALTVTVKGSEGTTITNYRWLLEEDLTFHPDLVTPNPTYPPDYTALGLNFHRSYMPVVAKGTAGQSPPVDPTRHYFLSILPVEGPAADGTGYTMGGAAILPGQSSVTVTLNKLPLPTAQISVFVFHDNQRINGVPDLPQENGLQGFQVNIREAGGRYGANGELVTQDAFGNPLGVIKTNANGVAIIKNLPPAKYGITISPPAGKGWIQTSTIEGSPTIDAWVKANEPPYFTEFGPAGHHCDFGFVKVHNDLPTTGGATIQGRVVSNHMSRPPDYSFHAGAPFPDAIIGLNDAAGRGVFVKPCNDDSTFAIPNVPPGNYQLAIWDKNLDVVFATAAVTVNPGGHCGPGDIYANCNLGDVAVFDWFGHLQGKVFYDTNQNGMMDTGEVGLQGRTVNLRWRDGSIYLSGSTGADGSYHIAEVFPFFNWLVAEVDFANLKATGMTAVVDAGGAIPPASPGMPSYGRLNPQDQGGSTYTRTETGPVLTQGIQTFLGQTNVIDWGKVTYSTGENGGISGVVFYDTTRAENDPRYGFGETWQPGIPGVTVNLYAFDVNTGGAGALLQTVQTDSWDDSLPTDCPNPSIPSVNPLYALDNELGTRCYDGLRNFNQVRNAVFDGGYAFNDLAPGKYIVEVVPPPVYEVVGPEDKNVDFGETYTPSLLALPPTCAGPSTPVPQYLTLFPGTLHPYYDLESTQFKRAYDPDNPVKLNSCERKLVQVTQGKNAPSDFFLYTEVPIAAHVTGMILNDLANEFDPNNPNFGEKFAPSWVPVSFRDYTGKEVVRIYSDQYGMYNAVVPSTHTVNAPSPSGVAPNMLIACMNDPGPIPEPGNPSNLIIDPLFKRQYTQFCYTFQYMPGVTTYLDTPVLPTAAFAGQNQFPLDCEFVDGTPIIHSVVGPGNGGPYVPSINTQIVINSAGTQYVLNPGYDGTNDPNIPRDYGFGLNTNGTGRVTVGGKPLIINSWAPGSITARVPAGVTTGQLVVTRDDNKLSSITGITLTVGPLPTGKVVRNVPAGGKIQTIIDTANPGDLILVPPGAYNELVIMDRDVQLQGWGAYSVTINAVKRPGEVLQAWRDKVNSIVATPGFLLPGQVVNFDPANNEPGLLNTAEGPGILVLANQNTWQSQNSTPRPRIDGFTITGSDIGGGIVVNGYADHLGISNNRIISNHGTFAGGIRVGDPDLINGNNNPVNAQNNDLRIHHNNISQNGSTGGGSGGIGLFSGANGYEVTENFICGNFATGSGGGIGHQGLSHKANQPNRIVGNHILFNQVFNQMPGSVSEGAGISISGFLPVGLNQLSRGSGSVVIDKNLIEGNLAGSGDGGAISLAYVNGQDVQSSPNPDDWFSIGIFNNMITRNAAGMRAGGIALKDVLKAAIVNNAIAFNDSLATAGDAFTAGPGSNASTAQPGSGVIAYAHSPVLAALVASSTFSNPVLDNDIIYQNRSFFWQINPTTGVGSLQPSAAPWNYSDLAIIGAAGAFNPRNCILTTDGVDPGFVSGWFNGPSGLPIIPENTTPLTAAAADEGGNFIDVRFGPLTRINPGTGLPYSDLHIVAGSPAVNAGRDEVLDEYPEVHADFDLNPRGDFGAGLPDIGADEYRAGVADEVTIVRITYTVPGNVNAPPRMQVRAVSSLQSIQPRPVLKVYAHFADGTSVDLGDLPFGNGNEYSRTFPDIDWRIMKPIRVTVLSDHGGSDSEPVPYP